MSKTTKTNTTAAKAPTVPFLVRAIAQNTQGPGYEFSEWPTIMEMLPEFLKAVREDRADEFEAINAFKIAERVVEEHKAKSEASHVQPEYAAFTAALRKLDIPYKDDQRDGTIYADEYLQSLTCEYTIAGLLTGIAFAHAYMVEAGIIGNGGAR